MKTYKLECRDKDIQVWKYRENGVSKVLRCLRLSRIFFFSHKQFRVFGSAFPIEIIKRIICRKYMFYTIESITKQTP